MQLFDNDTKVTLVTNEAGRPLCILPHIPYTKIGQVVKDKYHANDVDYYGNPKDCEIGNMRKIYGGREFTIGGTWYVVYHVTIGKDGSLTY